MPEASMLPEPKVPAGHRRGLDLKSNEPGARHGVQTPAHDANPATPTRYPLIAVFSQLRSPPPPGPV